MSTPPDTIKHLHALASHPATPEHERAQAKKILRRLMEKYGLNEDDLDDTATVSRKIVCVDKHWQTMVIRLAVEIKDNVEIEGLGFSKGEKRGHTIWHVPFTSVEYADFRAALAWYSAMLEEDKAAARKEAKRVKKECMEKIRLAAMAVREVHPAFISKYALASKQYARWSEEQAAKRENQPEEPTQALAKPVRQMSKKEMDEANRRWKARREAEGFLQDGDRWEKPAASVGSGNHQLGNGETFQLSND